MNFLFYNLFISVYLIQQCYLQHFKIIFHSVNLTDKYNSRRQHDLYIRQSNSNWGRKCLKTKACALWNKLPNEVKSITEKSLFCKTIKKYLIDAKDGD